MKFFEIENMGPEELKRRRNEILSELQKVSTVELSSRYLQARIDAKTRDVRLGEMGVEIGQLRGLLPKTSTVRAPKKSFLDKLLRR